MKGTVAVIGSGAAGIVSAWELSKAGWSVTLFDVLRLPRRGRIEREGFSTRTLGDLQLVLTRPNNRRLPAPEAA